MEFGPFQELMTAVGFLTATAGALVLGFRGRSRWEPSEQDIPKGLQQVGTLLTAVILVVVWVQREELGREPLISLVLGLAGGTVGCLLLYGILVGLYTYDVPTVENPAEDRIKIIGGLWLTPVARAHRMRGNAFGAETEEEVSGSREPEASRAPDKLTIQEVLADFLYQPDRVWPRSARATAKAVFGLSYLGLTVSGASALATAALLLIRS